jgi:LysR family transcriptional regulator for bpeEF and oprC
MLPSPREPDLWALFRPRQLRAAKVQVFVDFLAQIVQDALMRIDYQL